MDIISYLSKTLTPGIIALILRLDEEAFKPLEAHTNKTFCIQIENLSVLYFQIQVNKVIALDKAPEHVDVTFQGPLSAFFAMMTTSESVQHGLHIRGDMECAKALYDAWHQMDFDIEGFLASFVGDSLAHTIAQGFVRSKSFVQELKDARFNDLGAYLQDEAKLLPTRIEIEKFFHAVDVLRHDVERLSAKIHLLQQQQSQGN